jgi:hypothetical protein
MRIFAEDNTSLAACPDTGSTMSLIQWSTPSNFFPSARIQLLENGLTLIVQGVGCQTPATNSFVYLPIRCRTMSNTVIGFPPVRIFVIDEIPESVVLLGLNFIIPDALDFRWGREYLHATHRLQIGDAEDYIRIWTTKTAQLPMSMLIPCNFINFAAVQPGQKPRNSFHAFFLNFRLLILAAMFSLLNFCIVIMILTIHGQEILSKQLWLWAINLFLFTWVTMHAAALGVLEWDSWCREEHANVGNSGQDVEEKILDDKEFW